MDQKTLERMEPASQHRIESGISQTDAVRLERYYLADPIPDGGLLARGWARVSSNPVEFFRRLGGPGTPFVTYDLTVLQRGEDWIPYHGSIAMEPVASAADAANTLMNYRHGLKRLSPQ
ncbi:hypothetical protein [Acidovorax carolinensis]|uniref:hypothetical protein n=1 Tax=Acidovorax carolinensis TaxID=553814 RepID=UPI0012FFC2F2|nr:hypothetical protein [Acidovorax carolinensis]